MGKNVKEIVAAQGEFFLRNLTKDIDFRKDMLKTLREAVEKHEEELYEALGSDLSKSKAESYMTEISVVYQEIDEALKHLDSWCRAKRVRGSVATFPGKNKIYSEPYGVVLILAPWNYPVQLSLVPLVGAIAAGNCVVLKCSKSSPSCARTIQKLLNEAFEEKYLYCADAETPYDEVLDQEYNYIFFTGSPSVGKQIMETAAKRLIPVSLELGGKSPCIVDKSAKLSVSAKRIAWGKFLNAGQTCIAVDYVLVDNAVKDDFVKHLQKQIAKAYPNAEKDPSYPKIINKHHYDRLTGLLATEQGVIGGRLNPAELKISPALMPEAQFDHKIMEDEIFGPLLPIIGYDNIAEAVAEIKKRPRPLACYIFSRDKKLSRKLISQISFGGGCVNDAVVHASSHRMPFGGVGNSGMGGYHGRHSFETFSHKKAMVENGTVLDVPLRYAPYSELRWKILKKFV